MPLSIRNPKARSGARRQPGIVLALALMLTGCSTFKLWYGFADSMIESRAEDYLELDSTQSQELAKQSAALVAWHKKEMLPKYAVFFHAQADLAAAGGWDRPQMHAAFDAFRQLLEETVAGASPYVAHVLSGHMTEAKLAYLQARMSEYIAERRADEQAERPEESLEERVQRRAKGIARFTGKLSREQIAIIRRHMETRRGDPLRWLANREKRNAALVAFLRRQPERPEIAQFVQRIVLRPHEITDPDYRIHSDAFWASLEAIYFDVMKTLSDEQRRHLVTTLRGYADDMLELSVRA